MPLDDFFLALCGLKFSDVYSPRTVFIMASTP
jgi:hypothetical protein